MTAIENHTPFEGVLRNIDKRMTADHVAKNRTGINSQCEKVINEINSYKNPSNPMFSTPERTWEVFIQSLAEGNKRMALSCFTGDGRNKMSYIINNKDAEAMKIMSKEFNGFGEVKEYGNIAEGFASRNDRVGSIQFRKSNREWKIYQF